MNCGISFSLRRAKAHDLVRSVPVHRHPDAASSKLRHPRSRASCKPIPSPCRPGSCGYETVDRQRCDRERRILFPRVALVVLLSIIELAATVALAASIAALADRADLVDLFFTGGARHFFAVFLLKYMCPLCLRGDVNDKTFLASLAKP